MKLIDVITIVLLTSASVVLCLDSCRIEGFTNHLNSYTRYLQGSWGMKQNRLFSIDCITVKVVNSKLDTNKNLNKEFEKQNKTRVIKHTKMPMPQTFNPLMDDRNRTEKCEMESRGSHKDEEVVHA